MHLIAYRMPRSQRIVLSLRLSQRWYKSLVLTSTCFDFDTSAAIRFHSSSRTLPGIIYCCLSSYAHHACSLLAQLRGGLESTPISRIREAHSHLLCSMVTPSMKLPSCHTVPSDKRPSACARAARVANVAGEAKAPRIVALRQRGHRSVHRRMPRFFLRGRRSPRPPQLGVRVHRRELSPAGTSSRREAPERQPTRSLRGQSKRTGGQDNPAVATR
jgi:hypothetical protein